MGLAQFFDRVVNPTNGLGQLGQALLAGAGGPIGSTFQALMSQRGENEDRQLRRALMQQQLQQRQAPHYERVGDDLLVLDNAGNEVRRIPGAPRQSEFDRTLIGAGFTPGTPQWTQQYQMRARNMTDPLFRVPGFDAAGNPTISGFRASELEGGDPETPMPTNAPSPAPSSGLTADRINAEAEAAIRAGRDPARVNQRRHQLLQQLGGPSQSAAGTFPAYAPVGDIPPTEQGVW